MRNIETPAPPNGVNIREPMMNPPTCCIITIRMAIHLSIYVYWKEKKSDDSNLNECFSPPIIIGANKAAKDKSKYILIVLNELR